MKNYMLIAVLLFSLKAFTQNFEGTIKWAVKVEITDPKRKAQMEDAQKKLADPAMQAQMSEMQRKMDDPQFRAMMENNPQMKAQLEKMVSGMQHGDGLSSLMPKELIIKIKDQNSLLKMDGGMFSSEVLYIKSKDQAYMLDRKNSTYTIMKAPAHAEKSSSATPVEYKITKTAETLKVLNHLCTKYLVEAVNTENKMTEFIWTTTEIKDFDLKSLATQGVGNGGHRLFYENIEGVPLKVQIKMKDVDTTMEVTEIKNESLSASDFTIPASFKEVPAHYK